MPVDAPPQEILPARAAALCRCWLFVEGASELALAAAAYSGADVLIQELEDFTPPALRPKARALAPAIYARWRAAGLVATVRINPLNAGGLDDLAAVMRGAPHIVALPKVAEPDEVKALDDEVTRLEWAYGLPEGSTALLPNIEFARGVMQTYAIAKASPRVTACLLAAEDLATDLNAERTPEGGELAYCRQRFLVECVAAGVTAVDYPYTFNDTVGLERSTRAARHLGFRAKSAVEAPHAAVINAVLTPSPAELAHARAVVTAFDAAREAGAARAEVAGALVEVPTYLTAKRLLARAQALTSL